MKYSRQDYVNWPKANYADFIMESGHWLVVQAFVEGHASNEMAQERAKYTLRLKEHADKPSVYQIIANAESEYDAAMKVIGDWTMWLRWKESKGLWNGNLAGYNGVGLKDALEAMNARIAGEAMRKIIDKADEGDYRAAKDLVTWGMAKVKTGKRVQQVPDAKPEDVISIAQGIKKSG